MTVIVDYASLTQAIADWSHNAALTSGGTPYSDAFIQRAQARIERDIPTLNFGNYIRFQEASYPAVSIANGVAPVPSDWLSPKSFQVLDGGGNTYPLIFKAATWLYDRYPMRQAQGLPAYIARDAGAGATNFVTWVATAGQTVFSLTGITGGVTFVTLDGQLLVAGTDYTVGANSITLASGALAGQTVFIQGAIPGFSASDYLTFTTTAGQTAFSLVGLNSGSQVLFAALDGSVLVPNVDYVIAGSTLTLSTGALLNQTLFVQGAPATASASTSDIFVFGPYPDSAYTVQGVYYQQAPLLSSTNTTNWMVTSAPDLLLAACMSEAATFLKDQSMLAFWGQDYTARLQNLVTADKAERWAASTLEVDVG